MSTVAEQDAFARLDDSSRLECRICWHVYDPAEGDEIYQIPAGTPFRKLPDYWRCPECDGEAQNYIVVED